MTLDWKKLAVYIALAAGGFTYWYFDRTLLPAVVPPPVVEQPAAPPAVAPPVVTPPVVTPPVVSPPVVEQPKPPQQAKPKARQKPKAKSKFVPRPLNLSPGCRDMPPKAYNHPWDVVQAAMWRLGYSQEQIDLARRCWNGEQVR